MTNNCGIYQITNTITGDFYIGSAVNLHKRFGEHRQALVNNKHCNRHLQNSWNKHDADSFTFEAVLYCDKEHLLEMEQFHIDNKSPAYNICQIAGSSLGIKLTDATRELMSAAKKGKPGHKHTDAERLQISEALKGKPKSAATRLKLSAALMGENNPNFGKPKSAATRALLSAANIGNKNCLGHKHTLESRALMSEVAMGNTHSLGHTHTPEARALISLAATRQWAARRIATGGTL